MRKAALAGALIALPLAALATPAQAASPNSAEITKPENGGYCFQALYGFTIPHKFIEVDTHGGTTTLTCHFTDVANPPNKAFKAHDFSCNTFLGTVTTNTSFVLTPSGQGTLVCKIKK